MSQLSLGQTAGIPGVLGALLILIWAVGFFVFGVHGAWHLLVPAGGLLLIAQAVRRINFGANEGD